MVKKNKFKYTMRFCKIIFTMAIIIASSFFADISFAQTDSKIETIKYHGIRPDDPGGRNGLLNPERGFRLDAIIGQPPGTKAPYKVAANQDRLPKGFTDDWLLTTADRYRADGITISQGFFFLNDFYDKPISNEKLALLQKSLNRFRQAGMKVLFRFTYENDMARQKGPTFERILSHLDQLEPLIKKNKDIFFTMQVAGIGAWGEWHSSTHYIEDDHSNLAKFVKRELEILPNDRMLQLRVMPKYERLVLGDSLPLLDENNAFNGTDVARLGFDDLGLLADMNDGGTWTEPPFYANPGNPEFDYVTQISPYIAVDGELYLSDQGGEIDGKRAIRRLRLHHFSSLSITQAYSGFWEGKRYSIDRWMETLLMEEELRKENLPISDGYFKNYAGIPVDRTVFEYIRDHLGYRIELQKAKFPQELSVDGILPVEIELINRGFATLINPRPVYFVLINTSGELVLKEKMEANPQTWQPFEPGDLDYKPLTHSIKGNVSLKKIISGEYMLGLWMPDADKSIQMDSRYAVRVANNDSPWWTTADGKFGVNIIGIIKITKE